LLSRDFTPSWLHTHTLAAAAAAAAEYARKNGGELRTIKDKERVEALTQTKETPLPSRYREEPLKERRDKERKREREKKQVRSRRGVKQEQVE